MHAPLRLFLALGCLLTLAGCVHHSEPPALYQLQQDRPATLPARSAGRSLLVGPLQLASYLQRELIVQRQQDGSLQLADTARWAGSLQDDIGSLLLHQLASRLETSRISLYPDRAGLRPELQVLLDISRFDAGPQQPAVLEGRWRLLDADGRLQDSRVLRLSEPHNGQLADQVRAQGVLLEQLSGQIASAVEALPAAQADSRPASPSRPRTEQPPRPPQIPVVMPTPTAEVYRF